MKKLISILALAALLSACGNSETPKTADTTTPETTAVTETAPVETVSAEAAKFATYNGEGFSFSYPENWKSVDTSQWNAPAIKAAFSDQSSSTEFADNINFTIEASASGSVDPEEFANNTANYYLQNGSAIGISEYKKTNYTNKPYKEYNAGVLEGTYTNNTGTEVVLVQYMIPSTTDLYSMTLTYAKDSYDQDEVNQIIDSLSISATLDQTPNANAAGVAVADFFNSLTPYVTSDTGVLDQTSYDFFAKHSDLFPASTAELRKNVKGLVDSNVTTRHLNKNVANYFEKFVKVSGQVIQVEEDNSLGSTFSIVLVMDDNGNYITALYPATTGDLLDGDFATVIGLPITNYSFQNVGGGFTNSTLIGASLVVAD
ncbi:hypothetical protein J2W91_003098 [Paenibacillus amylolyticus]|uniref:PsbP C-terminal domain-containing protein n=1 Tax=Paenibacillus amylolyticus TaxID=1451 RepID=A0AAP5H3J0_PAEAM|nr:LpqN/LpqT family lipoprotein [Paenibacillus amylolyticus]MDR6724630.1 hypothetical protein [Paenibacillus amylolyticus]